MFDARFIRQVGPWKWATRTAVLQARKRVLKQDSHLRLPTGLTMLLPRQSQSAAEVFVTKADIDWGAEALLARFADPGRDFLDIGAHIGYYSMYLAPLVRRAYAFEPDARSLPALHANARIAGNVEVVEAAVSSRDAMVRLHVGGGSAVASLEGSDGRPTIDVRALRIDTFCAGRSAVDPALVKTDVEGHDLEALRGMASTVARSSPLIITECSDHEPLAELCRAWRYTTFAFVRDPSSMRVTFRRMARDDHSQYWLKMLLLVPPHLDDDVAALVSARA